MIHIDFEKFNKAGLKPIIDKFEKAKVPVADVEGSNKAKRESGFQVKTATITFESGQKLIVKAKAGGSIFQVKLNNKVLAIKHVDDIDKAVLEIIDYVQENEKNYLKQLARQKVTVPKIKPASIPVAEQITQYQTSIDETTAAIQELNQQISDAQEQSRSKTGDAQELENRLAILRNTGDRLYAELKELEVAA